MRSWQVVLLALSWERSRSFVPHESSRRSGISVTLTRQPSSSDSSSSESWLASRRCDDGGSSNGVAPRSRRNILKEAGVWGATCASVWLLGPSIEEANAADGGATADTVASDLTTRMFNPDGSVKEGVESVARFRTVSISWDGAADNSFTSNVDGTNVVASAGKPGSTGASVRISYRLPEKWATGQGGGSDELYFDRTEGVNAKACRRITVFRSAGGGVSESQLERASNVGIAKALRVPADLAVLESADLVSGRTISRDDQRYFDFDMAVAPKTCDQSNENLGLGFCPYESIYLLSSTVLDGHLYVMVIESDKDEWKRANSDLKLVRNSFRVEQRRSDDQPQA